MAGRSLGALLLIMSVLLVGCLRGGAPVDSATVTDTNASSATCAGSCESLVAFEETNRTEEGAGGIDHPHDMWNGQSRVTMFETVADMEPLPDDQNRAVASFRPPDGKMVYEGTVAVEFSISKPQRHACNPAFTLDGHFVCTDYTGAGNPSAPPVDDPSGGPSGLKLRYKHASAAEWIDVGELTWGVPLKIDITDPRHTDMPHATSSVWRFQVVSPNGHDVSLKFTAKADILRGEGDVPLWPGHPLFYTEETQYRTVVDNVAAQGCEGSACAFSDPDKTKPVAPSKLISYGTRTLFVWVNISSAQFPNPALAPNAWFVYHRNATGQNNLTDPFDFENYGIEKKNLQWVLPVDDSSMDSPYADGSRWEFELGASYTTPDNPARRLSCYSGCADWIADYTITVIASSVILDPKEYHMSCLDDQVYCPQPEDGAGEARELTTGRRA